MISYDDALANLMAMFPDMDTETIAVVLRDHGGHMERTIDALLVMFAAEKQHRPKHQIKPNWPRTREMTRHGTVQTTTTGGDRGR